MEVDLPMWVLRLIKELILLKTKQNKYNSPSLERNSGEKTGTPTIPDLYKRMTAVSWG